MSDLIKTIQDLPMHQLIKVAMKAKKISSYEELGTILAKRMNRDKPFAKNTIISIANGSANYPKADEYRSEIKQILGI
ncbi:hypothetical protein [Oenococcus sicerae]|uniref:hypothetical protein n=1 Tax=Oenococcus sicerae TaxID=2203724 RepID=UPI0039E8409E